MSDVYVCPECGSENFHRDEYRTIRLTLTYNGCSWVEIDAEIRSCEDGEEVVCDDCGYIVSDDDDLQTPEQYEEEQKSYRIGV